VYKGQIQTILSDTGVPASRTVMIGDTSFDMDMGRAAGVATIGVSWGYHPAERLACDRLIHDFDGLLPAIDLLLGTTDE